MQLQMTVHNYAGTAEARHVSLVESSAQFAKRLIGAGYHGDAWAIADQIDVGEPVYIEQFDITVRKMPE